MLLIINKSLNYICKGNAILLFEVQKNTESKKLKIVQTKNERIMFLSKCAV